MIITCPGCQSHYHHQAGPQTRARCTQCDARFAISGSGVKYRWRAGHDSAPVPEPVSTVGMDDPSLESKIAINGLQSVGGTEALHWAVKSDEEVVPEPYREIAVSLSHENPVDDTLEAFRAGFGGSSAPIDSMDFGDPEVVAHYEEIEPVPEVVDSGLPGPPSHDAQMMEDLICESNETPDDQFMIEPPSYGGLGLSISPPSVHREERPHAEISKPVSSVRAPLWVLLAGAGTTAAGYHGAPILKIWLDRTIAFDLPSFFLQPPVAGLLSGCIGLLIGAGVARWMQRS